MAGREYGEVRKRLGNEPSDSSPYVGYARKLLGELKADMAINGLQQGVRRRNIAHEHGEVQIEVRSVFGQDQIAIIVPTGDTETKKREEEKIEIHPYLWVGIRRNNDLSDNEDYMDWSVIVSEPGAGIVADRPSAWGEIGLWGIYSVNVGPQDFDPVYYNQMWEWSEYWRNVPEDRRSFIVLEDHGIESNRLRFTESLLRMYDTYYVDPTQDEFLIQPPHDPLGETEEDIEARNFPDWWWTGRRKWDQVVVLDPTQGIYEPTDRRPGDLECAKVLAEKFGHGQTGIVLPGEYSIKFFAYGDLCNSTSSTETYEYLGTNYLLAWNETMTEYYGPQVLDVEVRVNKAPYTVTKTFQVTLERASSLQRDMWPFGDSYSTFYCGKDGFNHHYACWWQDCILVDVLGGSIRLAKNYGPDYFADIRGGLDPNWGCMRKRWDILVIVDSAHYPAGVDDYLRNNISEQIIELMKMTAVGATFGGSVPRRTVGEVLPAVTSAMTDIGFFLYDVEANTMSAVSGDVATINPAYVKKTWWDAEDYYRVKALQAGRGIGLVAYGYGGPFYIGYIVSGDPVDFCTAPDYGSCCE